jgi:hypothetical protein
MIMSPTAATKTMVEVMADLKTCVAACQAAYDVYDPACSRRPPTTVWSRLGALWTLWAAG